MLLSGRSLALQCKWNCCPRYKDLRRFHYLTARHGDTVFVNLDAISNFTSQFVLFGIRKKFILVCQNSDKEFNESWLRRLEPYALHIYSINCVVQHPTVTAIPIGFGDWSVSLLPSISQEPIERSIEIYGAFLIRTNPSKRQSCYDAIQSNPIVQFRPTTDRSEFYELLRRSKYVVCPEGEGHDTHRIYESLYFGAVPILLRGNPLTHMYERLGLPIKWVDSWSELDTSNWESDKAIVDEWISKNPTWMTQTYL